VFGAKSERHPLNARYLFLFESISAEVEGARLDDCQRLFLRPEQRIDHARKKIRSTLRKSLRCVTPSLQPSPYCTCELAWCFLDQKLILRFAYKHTTREATVSVTSSNSRAEINDAPPRKRHQKRHLEFCIAMLLSRMAQVRVLPGAPSHLGIRVREIALSLLTICSK